MISTLLVDRCGHRRRSIELARLEPEIHLPYLYRMPRIAFDEDPSPTILSVYVVPFVECDYGSYYRERWARPPDVPADACVFGIKRALVTAEEWREAQMRIMPFELAPYLAYRKNIWAPANLYIVPAIDGAVWIEAWPNDERLVPPDAYLVPPDAHPAVELRLDGVQSPDEVLRILGVTPEHEPPRAPEMPDTPVVLSPSDQGISDAYPLPPDGLSLEVVDLPWHEINRKFNALLSGAQEEVR